MPPSDINIRGRFRSCLEKFSDDPVSQLTSSPLNFSSNIRVCRERRDPGNVIFARKRDRTQGEWSKCSDGVVSEQACPHAIVVSGDRAVVRDFKSECSTFGDKRVIHDY